MVDPLDRVEFAKSGKINKQDAYEIEGWSGNWQVELMLLASGELLELEMKNKKQD